MFGLDLTLFTSSPLLQQKTWTLHDLQNKETGELPILHIYQLDSVEDSSESRVARAIPPAPNTTEDASESASEARPKKALLAIAQRRTELTSRESLHPFAHRVFGTPLLLRVGDFDTCSGRRLYDMIAAKLRSVVPKEALRFLDAPTEPACPAEAGGAMGELTQTFTDMEEVAAGPMPRYGFRLRLTTRDGRRCLSCPWYEGCIGCLVPYNDLLVDVMDGDSLAVDWHFAVDMATNGFGSRLNQSDPLISRQQTTQQARTRPQSVPIKNHRSVGAGTKKGGGNGAVTLEDCLDAFAKEENIPEAYCSKCKDFRIQTKRMSLWRNPPVVIIHLKRFQFTQHMRRKLRDLVVFPLEGLDLSRIMAKEAREQQQQRAKETGSIDGGDTVTTDDESASKHQESKNSDDDDNKQNQLYDLYAVVHHHGALSGGHYVASLKSEIDGQWRVFNDAQVFEIHNRDVVDASAYMLFYIRRDVEKAQLSDFWNVKEGEGLSEEDVNQLMRGKSGGSSSERCVVS